MRRPIIENIDETKKPPRAPTALALSSRLGSWKESVTATDWLSISILHDLRNPLAAIYTGAEILMDFDTSSTQVKRLATNIYRAAGRVNELLADLNLVVCGNRPTAEVCNIREIIATASEAALASTGNQSVQVVLDVPIEIDLILEHSRMKRVFFNLVTNALEAMPGGGEVRIRAKIEDNWLVIDLEDTGPGIPHRIRERLFQPFVTTGKQDGMGLGLALARQTILDHAGDIWTEPAAGSRFVIRLPLNRVQRSSDGH